MEGSEEGSEELEEIKGRAPEMLSQVLKVAEVGRFPRAFPHRKYYVMSALGSNIRSLQLQAASLTASFFPALFYNCPSLASLVVEGAFSNIITSLQICHPRLERLKLANEKQFILVLDCPSS